MGKSFLSLSASELENQLFPSIFLLLLLGYARGTSLYSLSNLHSGFEGTGISQQKLRIVFVLKDGRYRLIHLEHYNHGQIKRVRYKAFKEQ